MNFNAEKASRKWLSGAFGVLAAAMVTAASALLVPGMPIGQAFAAKASRPLDLSGAASSRPAKAARRAAVPLPKPRPSEAPPAGSGRPAAGEQQAAPKGDDKPDEQAASAPPPESACRLALTEAIAIAPSIPDIRGAGGCGGEDLVRLEAIVLPDQRRVSVKPAAILRCSMASALADWIRNDIAPLASGLGSTVSDLDNFDSYECRGRNRIAGARLSEHGRANAIDVRAFKLADGRLISLTDRAVPREFREAVLRSACARFPTVLGPGSDWYHEDHIHLDLVERRGNYRICQWNVWDPLPQVAPLMPADRPDDAPPREVAAKSGDAKEDDGRQDAGKSAGDAPAPGGADNRSPGATAKKRR